MPCVCIFLIPMGRACDAVCLRLCFPHFYGRVSMLSSFLWAGLFSVGVIPTEFEQKKTAARSFCGSYTVKV